MLYSIFILRIPIGIHYPPVLKLIGNQGWISLMETEANLEIVTKSQSIRKSRVLFSGLLMIYTSVEFVDDLVK